jgi:hypothetical protein
LVLVQTLGRYFLRAIPKVNKTRLRQIATTKNIIIGRSSSW